MFSVFRHLQAQQTLCFFVYIAVSPSRMGLGLGIAVCGKSIWLSGMPGEIVEDIGHHDIVFFAADH